MGGAAAHVDIRAVGSVVDDESLGTQRVEHAAGDLPCAAVGAIQSDPLAFIGRGGKGDEIADVAVAAGGIVDHLADIAAGGKGHVPGLAFEPFGLIYAVQIGFHVCDNVVRHLFAVLVDELDAIVVERIVAGGDHDAAVEISRSRNVGNAGRRCYVQHIYVCAGGCEARGQRVFEHIAGKPGILAEDDVRFIAFGMFHLRVFRVVPPQEKSDLEGMDRCKIYVGVSSESICSKILSHSLFPF